MSYRPDLSTFCDILRDYSKHGLRFFRDHSRDMQQRMRNSLAGNLEDNGDQIEAKLAAMKKGATASVQFLPMPRPSGTDFKASFFLPRVNHDEKGYTCSFCVIFWVERELGKTIGLRIEPTGGKDNAHAYAHVQLVQTTLEPKIVTSWENWVPTSYPAIPLGYCHPVQLFASMAVAVHGFSANEKNEYVRHTIFEAMAEGAAASRARQILAEVHRMLTTP